MRGRASAKVRIRRHQAIVPLTIGLLFVIIIDDILLLKLLLSVDPPVGVVVSILLLELKDSNNCALNSSTSANKGSANKDCAQLTQPQDCNWN
jgi:hypothetical protein